VKTWQLIVDILYRIIKWLDWYFSDDRKKKQIEDKMFKDGVAEKDEAKIVWAFNRRKRRKKK